MCMKWRPGCSVSSLISFRASRLEAPYSPSGVHLFSKRLHIQGCKRLNPQLTPGPLKRHSNPFYDLVFLLFFLHAFAVTLILDPDLSSPSLLNLLLYLHNTPLNNTQRYTHSLMHMWIRFFVSLHTLHPQCSHLEFSPIPRILFHHSNTSTSALTHTHTSYSPHSLFYSLFFPRLSFFFLFFFSLYPGSGLVFTAAPPPLTLFLQEFWPTFKNPKSTTGCCSTLGPFAPRLSPHMLTPGSVCVCVRRGELTIRPLTTCPSQIVVLSVCHFLTSLLPLCLLFVATWWIVV